MRGMGEVDVDLAWPVAFRRAPEQERLDRHRPRAVTRIPPAAVEIEVLIVLEAEQGERREAPALDVAAEQDRIFVLDQAEFVRDGEAGHHPVAELGRGIGQHAKVAVGVAVEDGMAGHCQLVSRETAAPAIRILPIGRSIAAA